MERLILICTFFLFINSAYSEYSLHSIFFINDNTGFAVGIDWDSNTNLILKTTNGGISWTIKSSGDSSLLYSIYFVNENTGFAVGEEINIGYGIIYKTIDGGDTWSSQLTESGNSLIAVHFSDLYTGYIAGVDYFQGSVIKKTTNGGLTWINQVSGTNSWLWSIFFLDPSNGYTSGANGTILKTTNGGEDWTALSSGTTYFLGTISFTSLNKGFAAGENGILLKTTDGGTSWQEIQSGTSTYLHSIYFIDSSTGYLAGNVGTILKTTNGGESWNTLASGTYEDLRCVHFPNQSDGYIIGTQETLLKTTDEGNNWVSKVIKALKVLSPNGGENLYDGSNHYIKWLSHTVENVRIDISPDNGLSWSNITSSHISDGEYYWTIDIPNGSDECLLKISDIADTSVYDISDEIFTILPVGITVNSPNGGEVWLNGSTQDITWTSLNLNVNNLRIRLSTDNGLNWNTIAIGAPNIGVYSWLINSPVASDECLIMIETLNHNFSDNSDSTFTIDISPGVSNESAENNSIEFFLNQNFPNPFNASTKIKYTVPNFIAAGAKQSQFVTLKVYNVLGNEVATLVNEEKPTGTYEVEFISNDLPSGIYFYKLQAGNFIETKKMIYLK